jgi:hypothetical protein
VRDACVGRAAGHGEGTPFGARIHAVATYLKTFQALGSNHRAMTSMEHGSDSVATVRTAPLGKAFQWPKSTSTTFLATYVTALAVKSLGLLTVDKMGLSDATD